MATSRWLLFVHQLPVRPLYLRAKVRHRLDALGAVALKKSVYALPRSPEGRRLVLGLAREVEAEGGSAHVFVGDLLEEEAAANLEASFRRARDDDYRRLRDELREARAGGRRPGALRARLRRARTRYEAVRRVDFFDAPGRGEAEAALRDLERRVAEADAPSRTDPLRDLRGRTWATRRGVQVDRIASAWFVLRFVDAGARFRFIDPAEERRPGEIRFDMAGGDFTHEDDRCTFETIVRRSGLRDAALGRVAQIVHDIDLKDGKYGRSEAPGVERLLLGVLAAHREDEARLARGGALFDDLYQSFRREAGASAGRPGRPARDGGGQADGR